jgi:hypothetical protein
LTRKQHLIVIALIGVLSAVNVASADAATSSPKLSRAAHEALIASEFQDSETIPKSVNVRCYSSNREFEAGFVRRFGEGPSLVWAYATRKDKTVHLRPLDCSNAKRFLWTLDHGQFPNKDEIVAFSTLLHEAMHVQGVRNERYAECLANDAIRYAALARAAFIHKSEANYLARIAFDQSAKLVAGPYFSVSGDCQRMLATRDWTWFIGLG